MSQMPDESDVPLINRVPPTSAASPSQLRPRNGGDVRWYKPTFGEIAHLMGWRWIYFIPALGFVIFLGVLPWRPGFLPFILASWKLIVVALALPTGYAINIAKHILRSRKEPFCIHCGYDLSGLPDGHNCPECG